MSSLHSLKNMAIGAAQPSLIRYPGGKTRLASTIAGKLLPYISSNTTYIEPFWGGGSVGLAVMRMMGSKLKKAVINDFNPSVAALWTSVIQQPDKLKDKVLSFTPSVEAFYDFKRALSNINTMPDNAGEMIELGFKKLAIHRISFSGLGEMAGSPLGGKTQKSTCKVDGRWNSIRLCEAIDSARTTLSMAGVEKCHCLSYEDILNELGDDDLVYLDPPYVVQGAACYKLAFSDEHHMRLAAILRNAKFSWLLSYDDCKQVRSLYSWAPMEILPVKNSLRHQKTADGLTVAKVQNELLLGNILRQSDVVLRLTA